MNMSTASAALPPVTREIYRSVLRCLSDHDIPHLVGGAYALRRYTGISRHTKDLDLFLRREDIEPALRALEGPGCTPEMASSHWLAKAHCGDCAIDLIFATGNGVSLVDDGWFERAVAGEALGLAVQLTAVEDILWTKAFIQERERYDGADVAHILLKADLDWTVLLDLFDAHWRVLLSHLVLFGFAYPSERDRIPRWVMDTLIERLSKETETPPANDRVCNGTLLSRAQYHVDVREWGFDDGRLRPGVGLSAEEIAQWTGAVEDGVLPRIAGDGD